MFDFVPKADLLLDTDDELDTEAAGFYFTHVTLQVEDTLYRLPRHYLERESEVLRDIFRSSEATRTVKDCDDRKTWVLDGVSKPDFEQLLRVLFPTEVLVEERLTVFQWASVLDLSASWCMRRVAAIALKEMSEIGTTDCRQWEAVLDVCNKHRPMLPEARIMAIRRISSTNPFPVAGVRMGRRYKVASLFRDNLQKLVQRNSYFTDEEEDGLGFKTTSKLYRIREDYHRCRDCKNCKNKRSREDKRESSLNAIDRAFKDELDDMMVYYM